MSKEKVVLAYSGGLDTSYCAKYLSESKNLEVHAVAVDTGGFNKHESQAIKQRAEMLGVADFQIIDQTQTFYDQCVRYLIAGNVLRYNTYPLSVSAERVFQAIAIARHARDIGAKYLAHGSTGAGNDQIRFDMIFHILCPEITILAPIREQQLTRQQEVDYLTKHGVELNWEKAKYSINKGLWGTSVGGDETLTSHLPLPEEAYPNPLQAEQEHRLTLHFEKGQPVGIDDEVMPPLEAIRWLEAIAARYAIGRDTHVGDTIVGIKGRVAFEAAAALIIIKAHHLLEKHTLTKWQLHWKDQLASNYGMLLHEGQYLDPVMRDIEAYLLSSQEKVSGRVELRLLPYRFELLGIHSDNDLMNPKFGAYGEENRAWDARDAEGFARLLANQNNIYHQIHQTL